VPDDTDARLVVLGVEAPHTRTEDSVALAAAKGILETRGTTPRLFRNTLVFLAADKARLADLDDGVRRYLAWQSIVDEVEALDLTPHQKKQATTQRDGADGAVTARLPETYHWLLVPGQSSPTAPVEWQSIRLSGTEALALRAAKKLKNEESLILSLAGSQLRREMDRVPLWRATADGTQNHVAVKQLMEDFGRYLYLPRLQTPAILTEASEDGIKLLTWEKDGFAYADDYDEAGKRYRGLRAGQRVHVAPDAPTGMLVKPERARRQLDEEKPVTRPPGPTGTETGTSVGVGGDPGTTGASGGKGLTVPRPRPQPRRFHGTVRLDAGRTGRDAGKVADEVLAHLVGLVGAEVTVTLEIAAQVPGGVPENVVRTVTENCRTLKFSSQGFEAE
jgi:hypothetical protein